MCAATRLKRLSLEQESDKGTLTDEISPLDRGSDEAYTQRLAMI